MTKQRPDQETINSIFDTISESDQNASVTLSILVDDMDFNNARRVVSVPSADGNGTASDPLNIYLHSVYHDGQQSLNILLDQGCDNTVTSSVIGEDEVVVLHRSESLKSPLTIEKGNDVCWAVLSDHENALSNLGKAYADHGMDMDVNKREAVPYSTSELRNNDAQKHTPLDLAVMLYVAQKRSDAKKEVQKTSEMGAMAKAVGEAIQPMMEKFEGAGATLGGIAILPNSNIEELTLDAPVTEKNIGLLLDRGAQGSIASYFPVSDESLDNPFNDNDAFEVMSLRDFCQENNHLFSPDMLSALKGDNTLSNEHGLN